MTTFYYSAISTEFTAQGKLKATSAQSAAAKLTKRFLKKGFTEPTKLSIQCQA